MAVKRKYRLNLRNYGNLPAIMLSQYDEGYALEFEIRDGTDAASDLSAYTVTLKGTRADTLAYSFAGTVSTNVLTFVIDTTMTACAGRGTAEIAIKDTANDVLFATFNMPVFVERAAVPEGSIDADVERAQEIAEQVQEIVDNAAAAVSGEAEKWATGQIDGTDVPSTDPTYENNAKYYAEQAADAAASIGIDATLTQAGKAADAKKTGDEITALKEDLNYIENGKIAYDYEIIANSYVKTDGTFANYNGWSRTGYIPVKEGTKIYIMNPVRAPFSAWYKNDKTMLSRLDLQAGSPVEIIVPTGAYYLAISADSSEMFTDIWSYLAFDGNVLNGKKWIACGDSFTAGDFHDSLTDDYTFTSGRFNGKNKVYPYWIGNRNNHLTVINEAIGGSTMTAGENGVNPFSDTRYTEIPSDADYITLEFGINDNGRGVPIGTIDDNDNTTFYGAWNVVLNYLTQNFPFAHIGIIVGPGMQTSSGQNYATAEIEIAKKWGIPYLNIQFESGGGKIPLMLRTSNPNVSNAVKTLRNSQQYVNGNAGSENYHPNEDAHEFESYFIESWLRTL